MGGRTVWGLIFGAVPGGLDLADSQDDVPRFVGMANFNDTALVKRVLDRRSDEEGAWWARAGGVSTSCASTALPCRD